MDQNIDYIGEYKGETYVKLQYNNDLTLTHNITRDTFRANDILKCLGSTKDLHNWLRLNATQEILEDIINDPPKDQTVKIPFGKNDLVYTMKGGDQRSLSGTYIHKILIYSIAQWASPVYSRKILNFLDKYFDNQRKKEYYKEFEEQHKELIIENNELKNTQEAKIKELQETNDKLIIENNELKIKQEAKIKELQEINNVLISENKEKDRIINEYITDLKGCKSYVLDMIKEIYGSVGVNELKKRCDDYCPVDKPDKYVAIVFSGIDLLTDKVNMYKNSIRLAASYIKPVKDLIVAQGVTDYRIIFWIDKHRNCKGYFYIRSFCGLKENLHGSKYKPGRDKIIYERCVSCAINCYRAIELKISKFMIGPKIRKFWIRSENIDKIVKLMDLATVDIVRNINEAQEALRI